MFQSSLRQQGWPELHNLLINLPKTHIGKKRETLKPLIDHDFMFLGRKTINFYFHVSEEIYLRLTKLGLGATLDLHVRKTEGKGQYIRILEARMKKSLMEFHFQKTLP